jgi:hypothetical protein
MPIHYFKCLNCTQMFVHGNEELPCGLACVMGKCDIREISREEAAEATEELRDEQENERRNN